MPSLLLTNTEADFLRSELLKIAGDNITSRTDNGANKVTYNSKGARAARIARNIPITR